MNVKGKAITAPQKYAIKPGKAKRVVVKVTTKGLKSVRKKGATPAVVVVRGGRTAVRIRR